MIWVSATATLLSCAGCAPSLHDVIGRGDLDRAEAMLTTNPELARSVNELGTQPLH
ncbi:MAG: hypothetical protein L3K26_20350 [Candidatus Hydrogenedentes bacterium]|nr:hypothetical protein [Candidatus Hydrogenedentota bacterium]